MKNLDIKKTRIISFLGLFLFSIGLFVFSIQPSSLLVGLVGLSISIVGWLVFSANHTKIAIHKLKQITDEYVKSVQNLKK